VSSEGERRERERKTNGKLGAAFYRATDHDRAVHTNTYIEFYEHSAAQKECLRQRRKNL
jgi:hypothetical protein